MSGYSDQAAPVAAALARLGVRPNERVLILLPDGPDFAPALAGVIHYGAKPLTVNPLLRPRDIMTLAAAARSPADSGHARHHRCTRRTRHETTPINQWAIRMLGSSRAATPLTSPPSWLLCENRSPQFHCGLQCLQLSPGKAAPGPDARTRTRQDTDSATTGTSQMVRYQQKIHQYTCTCHANRCLPGQPVNAWPEAADHSSARWAEQLPIGVVLIDKPNGRRRGPPQLRCSLAVALDHPGACWIMLRSTPGAVAGRSR